jgi:tetratricopeptide (TPR) repeat protein
LLEIFEHNRKSKRYIYEEIFTQLTPEEQKVMEILSTGRTPVPYNAFFINNEIKPDTIDLLVQKFVIKENTDGNYNTHEFVKEFFYKRLPPVIKTEYHSHFAKFYRAHKTPKSYIEAIYHYIKSLQYQDSIDLAINLSSKITGNGLSEKFLDVLEELPEEEVPLPQWADILILKARLCFIVGDWDSSIQYYQRSIEIGTEVGKEDNVAKAYFEIGKIFEERNIIEEALKSFEKGWEISKRIKNKRLIRDSKRGVVRLRMKIRNGF